MSSNDAASLLDDQAYATLPDADADRFVHLVKYATGRLNSLLEGAGPNDRGPIKQAYIEIIQGLGEELGAPGLPVRPLVGGIDSKFDEFSAHLAATMARLRARRNSATPSGTATVKLGYKTKGWLRQEIEQLGRAIDESDLEDRKKRSLKTKLQELLEEVDRERMNLSKAMVIIAAVAGTFAGTTTTIANAPKTIESVRRMITWIGADKVAEDDEQLRLNGPADDEPQQLLEDRSRGGGHAAKDESNSTTSD